MCGNCDGLTIPVGPAGPQGIQGPIGLTGETGPEGPIGNTGSTGSPGTNGTNGINGTNAFKFAKELVYEGIDPTVVIPYSEIVNCGGLPEACTPSGTEPLIAVDYHVQIWKLVFEELGPPPILHWELVQPRWNGSSMESVQFHIASNGDLSVIFENMITTNYRVVIIG